VLACAQIASYFGSSRDQRLCRGIPKREPRSTLDAPSQVRIRAPQPHLAGFPHLRFSAPIRSGFPFFALDLFQLRSARSWGRSRRVSAAVQTLWRRLVAGNYSVSNDRGEDWQTVAMTLPRKQPRRRYFRARRHDGDHQQIMDTITIGIEAGMTTPSAAYYSPWLVPGIIRPSS
jgi:hypothetical protein